MCDRLSIRFKLGAVKAIQIWAAEKTDPLYKVTYKSLKGIKETHTQGTSVAVAALVKNLDLGNNTTKYHKYVLYK